MCLCSRVQIFYVRKPLSPAFRSTLRSLGVSCTSLCERFHSCSRRITVSASAKSVSSFSQLLWVASWATCRISTKSDCINDTLPSVDPRHGSTRPWWAGSCSHSESLSLRLPAGEGTGWVQSLDWSWCFWACSPSILQRSTTWRTVTPSTLRARCRDKVFAEICSVCSCSWDESAGSIELTMSIGLIKGSLSRYLPRRCTKAWATNGLHSSRAAWL